MKKNRLIYLTLFLSLIFVSPAKAEQKENVAFGGVYTAGPESDFPVYSRNKELIVSKIRSFLEQLNDTGQLPFQLLFDTTTEESKLIVNNNPWSLAFIITRDDLSQENFSAESANININKYYINSGLVAILYQTVEDLKENNKRKNSIVFSLPLVGYSVTIGDQQGLAGSDLDRLFTQITLRTIEDDLLKRLKELSLGKIKGTIKEINGDLLKIDLGSIQGLTKGQNIKILSPEKKNLRGKVEEVYPKEASIRLMEPDNTLKLNTPVEATNIKGLSSETYQVTDFKISSAKAGKLFSPEKIGLQASQWFSDFLAERSGKLVYPSRVGSAWIENANEQSFAVFIKDGQEHLFEVASPKYQVLLDLSGLSSKKLEEESNSISENWAYKIWLKVEIPEKNYSQEFDLISGKNVVVGTQSFEEKNEFFELLHQLTAKAAKEVQ